MLLHLLCFPPIPLELVIPQCLDNVCGDLVEMRSGYPLLYVTISYHVRGDLVEMSSGLGFRVQRLEFRVQGFGFRGQVEGFWFTVQSLGFRVKGLGFRV